MKYYVFMQERNGTMLSPEVYTDLAASVLRWERWCEQEDDLYGREDYYVESHTSGGWIKDAHAVFNGGAIKLWLFLVVASD